MRKWVILSALCLVGCTDTQYIEGVRDAWIFDTETELEAQFREPGRLRTTGEVDFATAVLECAERLTVSELQGREKKPEVPLAAFIYGTLSAECGVIR